VSANERLDDALIFCLDRQFPAADSSLGFRGWKAGGEGGIRTPDTRQGMAAFEAARFNHSRTSPRAVCYWPELPVLSSLADAIVSLARR
jgi:hypothetical protein